jgi:secondary thiamine-phosphate synthase enzyme
MIYRERISVPGRGPGLHPVTDEIARVVTQSGVKNGLCSIFIQHTSASLLITENADPAVRRDLSRYFSELAPESATYEHDDEGPDDMPAHLRTALTPVSETIPVENGRLLLGTWQGIYLFEHRRAHHERKVVVTVMGEP